MGRGGGLLLGVLLSVAITVVLWALVAGSIGGGTAGLLGSGTPGATGTSALTGDGPSAQRAACFSDAEAVDAALAALVATSRDTVGPESGITVGDPATYRHGRVARMLVASGALTAWPSGRDFALSVSTKRAGAVAVYVPSHSTTPVIFGDESGSNGCNAL